MKNQRSIKKNFLLYFIKQLMAIIFPLITFPYASHVLGVTGIGKVNYSKSIVSYFVLLSGLGIANYAIREGARIRDNKEKINQFTNELFCINLISTIVSLFLCYLLIFSAHFSEYKILLIIFSFQIPFTTLGIEWLYNIQEDYKYITIRAIAFQIISLILMFTLVKSKDDFVLYAFITTISAVGSNLLNIIHSRKYIKLFSARNLNLKRHIKPIFVIFGMTVTSQIYLNMDITMVGLISGDKAVGLYSAANKLIITVVALIGVLKTVMLPRLSYTLENGSKDEYESMNSTTIKVMLLFVIPVITGLFCLSEPLMNMFCGQEFTSASLTLRILLPEVMLSTLNGFIVFQIFMPQKKEKWALIGTIIGAIVNLISNTLLIPIFHENGAAFSTCLAEGSLLIYLSIVGRNYIYILKELKVIWKNLLGGISIIMVVYLLRLLVVNNILYISMSVILGAIVYGLVLFLLRDEIVITFITQIKKQTIER